MLKMASTASNLLPGYEERNLDNRDTPEDIPLNTKMDFWLTVVSTLGSLYKVDFLSVYTTEDHPKGTLDTARRFVE